MNTRLSLVCRRLALYTYTRHSTHTHAWPALLAKCRRHSKHQHTPCSEQPLHDERDELCAHVHFSHIQKEQSYVSITNTHNYYYDSLSCNTLSTLNHVIIIISFYCVAMDLVGRSDVVASSPPRQKLFYAFITTETNDKALPTICACERTRAGRRFFNFDERIYCAILEMNKIVLFQVMILSTEHVRYQQSFLAPRTIHRMVHLRTVFDLFCLVSIEFISEATTQIEYHPWS